MPLHCCNCECDERVASPPSPLRRVRILKECSSIESIDSDLKRLNFLCSLNGDCCEVKDNHKLETLKTATHEIKKLIDKVDDNLVTIKANKLRRSIERLNSCKICDEEENKRDIIDYLNKNCKTHSNSYYCCCKTCCNTKSESEQIVELIRHKHSQHKDTNVYPVVKYPTAYDKHCDKCDWCWNDYKIRARRERSRSRNRSHSNRSRRSRSRCESDDECYYSSGSHAYKPCEPWRAGPYSNQYPWATEKINEMRK